MNNHNKPFKRGSLVWPLVLIGLGFTFLLNNLGVWGWDIWLTIIRLWPLLLVAIGLDLLLGRKAGVWAVISVLLIVGLVLGGALAVRVVRSTWAGNSYVQDVSIPLEDSSRAEIEVTFGLGEIKIGKLNDSHQLLEGAVRVNDNEILHKDLIFNESTAYLKLWSTGTQFYPSWLFHEWGDEFREWEINLTEEVPIDLEINSGIGLASVNLSGIRLMELNIESSVGELSVYLPDYEGYNAWISLGVGELVVYVPSDINIRIHLDHGFGNTSISGDFLQVGNIYYSSGFDDSEDVVDLFVDGGIGEVRIIQTQR